MGSCKERAAIFFPKEGHLSTFRWLSRIGGMTLGPQIPSPTLVHLFEARLWLIYYSDCEAEYYILQWLWSHCKWSWSHCNDHEATTNDHEATTNGMILNPLQWSWLKPLGMKMACHRIVLHTKRSHVRNTWKELEGFFTPTPRRSSLIYVQHKEPEIFLPIL